MTFLHIFFLSNFLGLKIFERIGCYLKKKNNKLARVGFTAKKKRKNEELAHEKSASYFVQRLSEKSDAVCPHRFSEVKK
jgi:hypothetical protein